MQQTTHHLEQLGLLPIFLLRRLLVCVVVLIFFVADARKVPQLDSLLYCCLEACDRRKSLISLVIRFDIAPLYVPTVFSRCLRIVTFEAVQLVLEHEAVIVHVLGLAEVCTRLICLHVHLLVDDLLDGGAVGVIVIVCHRHHARVRQSPSEAPRADLTVELRERIAAQTLGSEDIWILAHDSHHLLVLVVQLFFVL